MNPEVYPADYKVYKKFPDGRLVVAVPTEQPGVDVLRVCTSLQHSNRDYSDSQQFVDDSGDLSSLYPRAKNNKMPDNRQMRGPLGDLEFWALLHLTPSFETPSDHLSPLDELKLHIRAMSLGLRERVGSDDGLLFRILRKFS